MTDERNASEPGRPHAAGGCYGNRGPRQEVEETKLSGKVRGVGRLCSTWEASNKTDHKSVAESVEGRRPVGGKVSGNHASGPRAGIGMARSSEPTGSMCRASRP